MKKVVLVGTVPINIEGTISGPQRVGYNIFKYLSKMEIDVEFLNIGIKIKGIKRNELGVYNSSIINALIYLLKTKPDIVHIVQYTGRSLIPFILLKKLLRYQLYYTAHGCIAHEINYESNLKLRDKKIEEMIFKYSDKIFVVSEIFKELVIKKYPYINKHKIYKISNGIEENIQYDNLDMRKKLNIDVTKKILLTVGVRKIKRIDHIIDNYKNINQYNNYVLIIVGNYDNEYGRGLIQKYKELIEEEKLIFTGELNQNELFSLYNQAFAYIQLSIYETFGLAIVEALSQGVPVIISNNIGVSDELDEEVKFVVNNKSEFKEAIDMIDIKYLSFKNICKNNMKRLGWKKIVEDYYKEYHI